MRIHYCTIRQQFQIPHWRGKGNTCYVEEAPDTDVGAEHTGTSTLPMAGSRHQASLWNKGWSNPFYTDVL